MANPSEQWHLSKSVPVTLIMGLLIQAVAIVWTVSTMSAGIEQNKADILRNDTRITTVEGTVHSQAIALARIDENIKAIRAAVEAMVDASN